ncbi:hypothetical protein J7F01_35270 [Streptomyces sp. ISL-22]|nr:hypothetical protein [Streptomyces sp. ISL-24]MBT2437324.1 hypothetical protein [Streptomyces sp. ISL-22]
MEYGFTRIAQRAGEATTGPTSTHARWHHDAGRDEIRALSAEQQALRREVEALKKAQQPQP